jgi:hypothetical protein
MKKADTFDAGKWLVENKITTQSRLNEEIESVPTDEEIKISDLLSTGKTFNQLKPFFIAKVKGFKPGMEKKYLEIYNSLLKDSGKESSTFNNSNLPGNPDFFKDPRRNEKVVKATSPKDVENKVWEYFGYNFMIPIKYKDLEYNLYQVNPEPKITQLSEGKVKNQYVVKDEEESDEDYDFYVIDKKKAFEYLKQFNSKEVSAKQFIKDDEGWGEFEQYLEDVERMSDKQLEKAMREEMSIYFFSDPDELDQ